MRHIFRQLNLIPDAFSIRYEALNLALTRTLSSAIKLSPFSFPQEHSMKFTKLPSGLSHYFTHESSPDTATFASCVTTRTDITQRTPTLRSAFYRWSESCDFKMPWKARLAPYRENFHQKIFVHLKSAGRVIYPIRYLRFRVSTSAMRQYAAFAFGVPHDINGFHPYTMSSAYLSHALVVPFLTRSAG